MSQLPWLQILQWAPSQCEDLRCVGYSYLKQGLLDVSLCFFQALIDMTPSPHPYDLRTLGAIYLQKGLYFMALHYLEQSLKLDHQHAPTLLNRAKALAGMGLKRQARLQARFLEKNRDPLISQQAVALLQILS